MSIEERNDQIDRAFHALEFAHLVTACGGMSKEVEMFGRSLNIDVDLLKAQYATESHGGKTIEQVAMEGILTSLYDWISEHKRGILAALTAIGTGVALAGIAVKYGALYKLGLGEMSRMVGITAKSDKQLMAEKVLRSARNLTGAYLINRGILGMFNSLPAAVKSALDIPLPTRGPDVSEYKQNVIHALKIRTKNEGSVTRSAAAANAHDHGGPPGPKQVDEAIKACADAAESAKRLEFLPERLISISRTPAAKTPVGAAALRWLTNTVTGVIEKSHRKVGAVIKHGNELKSAIQAHEK